MKRLIPILLLVICVGCLWQAGRLHRPLLKMREEYGLNISNPVEGTPPLVVFTTIALGGFRGLLADILWIRATKLQQEGKYFELVQLADWITKLEPRFTAVWAFHAWNMAYNVSVMLNDPADRWRWVRHGIVLLRDQGILYNPRAPNLYRELGWLYQHKIGGLLDQAHPYYKRALAQEMMGLFNGSQPNYEELVTAARTEEALLARPGVAELVTEIKELGKDPFSYSLLQNEHLPSDLRDLLADHHAAGELLRYLRRQRMEKDYKLVPELMKEVYAEYGPLDWRLPQAHAIYWAWRGKPYASGFDLIALNRMIFQSMADAFLQGKLFVDREEGVFQPSPNLDLLPKILHTYEQAVADHPDQSTIQAGHRNFLERAILTLYSYNRIGQAQSVFEDLKARYKLESTERGLENFVYRTFVEESKELSREDAQALVESSLEQSFRWLALGEEDRAAGFDQLARILYNQYMKGRENPELKARVGLPPFKDLREQARGRISDRMKTQKSRDRIK